MSAQRLINRIGPLGKTYPQLESNTIRHSNEITNERRLNKELREKFFWTADFAMYTFEEDKIYLNLTTRENNLIFKNIEETTEQLIKKDDYKKEDIETVINSKNTLKINLSDLKLERYNKEFSYFEIDTTDYDGTLNQAQRKIAERAYGQGDDFKKNMKMFKDNDVNITRIYALNPNYVYDLLGYGKNGDVIGQPCRLGSFAGYSSFTAIGGFVSGHDSCLRGVPKVNPAQKTIDSYTPWYFKRSL